MQDTLLTDGELIKLLSEGDENAFQEIYRRYWYKLFMVAKRKVAREKDAEEIVQDIFVDLWERRSNDHIVDLDKFLFGAVKYKILNYIRAKIVRRKHQTDTLAVLAENDSNTEETLALSDLREAIAAGVAQLPEKTREIFRLNRMEGLSVKEISAELQVPERTIEYHITQSLRAMRAHLKEFIVFTALMLILQ